jgi:hypothetical protein
MDHSVFALELCFRADLAPGLVTFLRQRLKDQTPAMSRDAKWRFYRDLSAELVANLHVAERGCWDFFDDNARAKRDYDMWVGGMTTREGARGQPSGGMNPYRAEPRYLTVTMSFLIHNGTPSERALAEACNVWETNLWQRATFAKLLTDIRMLSFASVRSDVVYLIPRDEGWELTPQDLTDPKFEYLRMIQG